MASSYKGKTLAQMTSSERAKRVAELVRTKNTSAIKDPKYLPAEQRQERALNTRLKQPIVAGSTVTNRDLAHQRSAAITTEFGPNAVAKQEQQGKDVSGWYDQYLAQLSAYQQGVQAAHQKAQTDLQGLATINQGPTEQAPQGPGSNASVAGLAQQAQLSRGNQFANLQGTQRLMDTNANDYAAALAHVVGPGQKLSAQAGEAQKLTDLKSKIGAKSTLFDATTKSNEAKNVQAGVSNEIAAKTLGVKIGSQQNTATNQAANRRLQNKKWSQATDKTYDLSNGAVASLRRQGATGRARLDAAKKGVLAEKVKLKKTSAKGSTTKDVFGNSRDQQIGRTSDFRKINVDAADTIAAYKKRNKGRKPTVAEVKTLIGPDYSSTNVDVLTGAIQMASLGRVGPKTAAALKALGIDPNRYHAK